MTLLDVTASILLINYKQDHFGEAKTYIMNAFETHFSHVNFLEWNTEVSIEHAKNIVKIYEDSPHITLKDLIEDLPVLVAAFRQAKIH
jgi:hypothetical protein